MRAALSEHYPNAAEKDILKVLIHHHHHHHHHHHRHFIA